VGGCDSVRTTSELVIRTRHFASLVVGSFSWSNPIRTTAEVCFATIRNVAPLEEFIFGSFDPVRTTSVRSTAAIWCLRTRRRDRRNFFLFAPFVFGSLRFGDVVLATSEFGFETGRRWWRTPFVVVALRGCLVIWTTSEQSFVAVS
jgi:hypothetical protein